MMMKNVYPVLLPDTSMETIVRSRGDVFEEFSSWRATPVTYGGNNRVEWDAP